MRTRDARAVLPDVVPRALALHQAAQVAAIVAAAATGDAALFGRALDDRLAEPVRAPLLPGFTAAKRAALDAGALGCSISGSGPTAFAIAPDDALAGRIGEAMITAYRAAGLRAVARLATPDLKGLQVIIT
jgi:homoserine kinase